MRLVFALALLAAYAGCQPSSSSAVPAAPPPTQADSSTATHEIMESTVESFYGFTVGEPYLEAKRRLLEMGSPVPSPSVNGQTMWEQRVRTEEGTLGIFSCISEGGAEAEQQVAAIVIETSDPSNGREMVLSVADKAEAEFRRFGEPVVEEHDLGRIQISEQEWSTSVIRATVKRETEDSQPFSTTAKLETPTAGC